MKNTFEDNSLSIGNTPLVQINQIVGKETCTKVFAKIEGRNPASSVKCRVAAHIIADGEARGALRPGMEIIEATSGNTGIGLCFAGAAKGYKVNICMPSSMSEERKKIMKFFGANLILTEPEKGMTGAVNKVNEIAAEDKDKYFIAGQFDNPANPKIHELTTGPEIWEQTNGEIDVLVSGVGTGGTISGVSNYIKNIKGKKIISVAVEPFESDVIFNTLAGIPVKHSPHGIQGIGAGFLPKNLDLSLVDLLEKVKTEDAIKFSQKLAKEEGILSGISGGAAMAAAYNISQREEFKGKTIVVIIPDSAERYISTPLFNIG